MATLDRYIGSTWIRLLVLCLSGFVSIYLVIDLIENIPRFMRAGGTANDIIRYFVFKLPEIINRTATFSVLMATMLTLGVLSRNSEIIAFFSCGISLMRISLPLLSLGIITSILLLINSEFIVPRTFEITQHITRTKIKNDGNRLAFKRNNIWFRSQSMILQAQLFEPEKQMLRGVVVWNVDGSMNPISRIDAETAVYKDGRWILDAAVLKGFSSPIQMMVNPPKTMALDFNLKIDDLRVLGASADNMSIRTLKEYAENLRRGGYQTFRYVTLMHSKIASSFASFVMVLLGLPVVMHNSRTGGIAMGISSSIAIGFAYFVVNAVLLSFGGSGALSPVFAAWGANVLFVLIGVWLSMTIRW